VIGVLEPREGPAERIIGPRQAGQKCDGRIFRRDGGRIVDAGMAAGTCHKPDDERSLWTVVVIGVLEPREGPAEKRMVPDRPAENAMVASNHVYPDFSGTGPDREAPTRRRSRSSTRTLVSKTHQRARQTDLFIKKGKTHIATKTSIRQSPVSKSRRSSPESTLHAPHRLCLRAHARDGGG